MTKKELFDLLQSVESTPEQTESPVITITKSQYLKLVKTLDQHSNRIGILVNALSKLGETLHFQRTTLSNSGVTNFTNLMRYDNTVSEVLVVSNQINLQYNLMVTSILEVIESNG